MAFLCVIFQGFLQGSVSCKPLNREKNLEVRSSKKSISRRIRGEVRKNIAFESIKHTETCFASCELSRTD
jgi:hypothetical protein